MTLAIELQRITGQDDCYLSCGDRDMINDAADTLLVQDKALREAEIIIHDMLASGDGLAYIRERGKKWLEKRKAGAK